MMRNLFVIHSQAQLILSVGLVTGRFLNQDNHLILFTDFAIEDGMKSKLKEIFNKVAFLTGIFPAINRGWKAKITRYPEDIRMLKKFMDLPYDKVFEVCDGNLPEIYILKNAFRLNNAVEMIWLEDGSYPYYLNIHEVDGLNSNIFTRSLRKIVFKHMFRLGSYYNFEGNFMGSNVNFKQRYLTFAGCEREIFRSKEIVQIDHREYRNGVKVLYDNTSLNIDRNAVILVLDKLDVYTELENIKLLVNEISALAKKSHRKLYYKLHPREENGLEELGSFAALDKNLGIEHYYSNLENNNILVLGVKSTGLQSAILFGFKTVSVAKLAGEKDNELFKFFEDIGVLLPKSLDELVEIMGK